MRLRGCREVILAFLGRFLKQVQLLELFKEGFTHLLPGLHILGASFSRVSRARVLSSLRTGTLLICHCRDVRILHEVCRHQLRRETFAGGESVEEQKFVDQLLLQGRQSELE